MSKDLAHTQARLLAAREHRRLARHVAAEQVPAKRAAARIEAAAYTTFVALGNVELLTGFEVQACQRTGPMLDDRARAIVDAYAGLCATELAALALRR